MVRIGGGVFPVIKEPDYLVNGEYRVDKGAAPKMLNCLMYKLCYYRFGELTTEYGKPPGYVFTLCGAFLYSFKIVLQSKKMPILLIFHK
jgi:hypothetical protein